MPNVNHSFKMQWNPLLILFYFLYRSIYDVYSYINMSVSKRIYRKKFRMLKSNCNSNCKRIPFCNTCTTNFYTPLCFSLYHSMRPFLVRITINSVIVNKWKLYMHEYVSNWWLGNQFELTRVRTQAIQNHN